MAGGRLRQLDWRRPGWHGLGLLWGVLLVCAGVGAGILQYLGPVRHSEPLREAERSAGHQEPMPAASGDAAHGHEAGSSHAPGLAASSHAAERGHAVPHREPGHSASHEEPSQAPAHEDAVARVPVSLAVHSPDPALLEKSGAFPTAQLPRVAADGRMARVVYAGPVPAGGVGLPRVALLLAGFGLSERDSRSVLDQLPGAVSLAVSAYATAPALVDAARAGGHELLASVPMEPQGYPLNDEGARSLRTGLSLPDNQKNLEWALSRTPGAVGATGASDGMRGERFADVSGVFDPALEEIGRRGLLYVDPRPGRALVRPGLPSRAVDVVLDESLARAEIEAKLVALERVARERGSAIGLAGPLRPVTIERIAAWVGELRERGLVLVPVSALMGDKS